LLDWKTHQIKGFDMFHYLQWPQTKSAHETLGPSLDLLYTSHRPLPNPKPPLSPPSCTGNVMRRFSDKFAACRWSVAWARVGGDQGFFFFFHFFVMFYFSCFSFISCFFFFFSFFLFLFYFLFLFFIYFFFNFLFFLLVFTFYLYSLFFLS
jgi:hypothetical protein